MIFFLIYSKKLVENNPSISTVLNGNGIGSLDYGNCNTEGKVELYLNNKQISSAEPSTQEKAVFQFHDQDVLKMVQHGMAIIQYNDFNVINCAGKLFYGSHHITVDSVSRSRIVLLRIGPALGEP